MSSKVFQSSARYAIYETPSSAFAKGGQNFDRPIGQVRELTRRFRVLCLTFLLVALCLLLECVIQLTQKMPDIWVAEQTRTGFVERVVLLPYDEERYAKTCLAEHSENRCQYGK